MLSENINTEEVFAIKVTFVHMWLTGILFCSYSIVVKYLAVPEIITFV
jgi:hypothetical protein